jgi:hypothetical protein
MLKTMPIVVVLALAGVFGWLTAAPTPAKAADCFTSRIVEPAPFLGNDEIFQLSDGSFWKVQYEYRYLYLYYPSVIICPSIGTLSVDGKQLSIARLQQPKSK